MRQHFWNGSNFKSKYFLVVKQNKREKTKVDEDTVTGLKVERHIK